MVGMGNTIKVVEDRLMKVESNKNEIPTINGLTRENTYGLVDEDTEGKLLQNRDTQKDINQYPILKLVNQGHEKNHWTKFGNNLEKITMERDCLLEQERIWNKVNLELISTLGSNNGMT